MNRLTCRQLSVMKLVLLSVAVSLASCSGDDSFHFTKGTPVSFIAGTGGGMLTRTSYSNERSGNSERIDWEPGDLIRIYCGKASEPESKYADYKVSEGSITADGATSKASIEGLGGIGIRWGNETDAHTFYAVCPSPATPSLLTGGLESDVLSDGLFDGHVDAVQTPLSVDGTSSPYMAVPDMTSQYMVAATTVSAGDQDVVGSDVFLSFQPIVTAIEFTIQNDYANDGDLQIASVSLESESHYLYGPFRADMTAWSGSGYPSVSSSAFGESLKGKVVSIDFSSFGTGCFSIAKGEQLVLTFFLLPDSDLDDLTFKITGPGGGWVSTRLATVGASGYEGLLFPRFKKSFVKGILVPEGAKWTVKNENVLTPWTLSSETPEGLILGHTGD